MGTRTMLIITMLALAPAPLLAATPPAAAAGAETNDALGKRFPGGTPEEVREAVASLERLAGFDPARDLLTSPYRAETIDAVVEAAWSPVFEVRSTALHLLALAVRQLDLPDEVLHQRVLPAARAIVETGAPSGSAEDQRLIELARRVIWHAEIRELTHPDQRLEALAAALDNRQDGYYYPIEALSYLADMGTEDALVLLEATVAESQHRSLSPKLLDRVRATAEKVSVQMRLRTLDAEGQVLALSDALIASLPDRSLPARDFQAWLVRELGEREVGASQQVLSRIAGDETLRSDLRYEAERQLQALRSRELPRN